MENEAPSTGTSRSPRKRREEAARKTPRGRWDPWVEGLLATIVIGSVLAVGTVHTPTLMVVASLSIGTCVLAMRMYRREQGHWPVTLPAVGIAALGVWTALQAVPMPAWLLARISPNNAVVWAHALDALGEAGPSWVTLSLDPGATWIEVLKAITYVGVATTAAVVSSRRGSVFGVALVFLAAIAAGLTTVLHGLAGMDKVFGLYAPVNHFAPWHIGPLLNSNHLAGYLNLGALCGLGLLLMQRPKVHPGIIGVGVAGVAAVSVAAASRGAIVLLPVGMAITVLLLRSRSSRHGGSVSRRALNLLTLVTAAGTMVLAALGMTTSQWDELASKDLSKLEILKWARPLIKDHWLLGIGRGSFETVYPAYKTMSGYGLWTHPENIVVQWASEWGVVVALLAAAFFVWLMRPKRLGATRSAVAAGAWAGIVVLVVQNAVDFSLEMPSVAIAVVTLIGSLWGDTNRRGVESLGKSRRAWMTAGLGELWGRVRKNIAVRRGLPVGYVIAGVFVLGMVASQGMPAAEVMRERMHELDKGPTMTKDEFRPIVRNAMLRHPADPYFPLIGAVWALRSKQDNPIPYVQRALERSRVYGRAHLLMAGILFAQHVDNQALLELKFATRDDPSVISAAVALAIEHTQDHDDLERMVPEGDEGAPVLQTLGAWLHGRNPAAGRQFDEEAVLRDGTSVDSRTRLAQDLLAELGKGDQSVVCGAAEAKRKCVEWLDQDIAAIAEIAPDRCGWALLRSQMLEVQGQPAEADKVLQDVCDRVTDRFNCVRARLDLAVRRKDGGLVETLVKQVAALGCTSSAECARTSVWVGDFETGIGNLGAAATAYERATQQDSSNADAYVRLGRTSATLGMWARAMRAFERAVKLRPGDAGLEQELETARTRVLVVR